MRFLLVLTLLCINQFAFAQEKKNIVVKTNSLIYVVKTGFNASFEIQTKKNKSLNFTFEKGNNQYTYQTTSRNKFIVLAVEKRKYFYGSKKEINPSGFFVGPYLKYRYKDKNQPNSGGFLGDGGVFISHSVGGGIAAGYQNHLFKRISIEPKLGLGFMLKLTSKGETAPTFFQPDGLIALSFGLRI
jgi:Protein of unknown function (DUF3575)